MPSKFCWQKEQSLAKGGAGFQFGREARNIRSDHSVTKKSRKRNAEKEKRKGGRKEKEGADGK